MTDASNGYERVAAVLDLGCGSGLPTTRVLVDEGLDVHALDAAPSMVAASRRNLPQAQVGTRSASPAP